MTTVEQPVTLGPTSGGVTDKPWDGAASRFTDAQYKTASAACDPDSGSTPKAQCFLPHHEPSGTTNRNGVHAAAQRASQVSGKSAASIATAKSHLRAHYSALDEDPPDSIKAALELTEDEVAALAALSDEERAALEAELHEHTGVEVELGGKPNPGTPADKRLKTNKSKGKSTPNSAAEPADVGTNPDGTIAPSMLPVMQEPPQWRGVLVVEGQATGDGREFAADSLTWAVPPLPFRWQKVDSHGGMPTNETVRVGTIQRVWRDGGNLMGEGVFDLSGPEDDDAHTAYRAMQSGALTGVSIDADDITDADIEYVFPDDPDEEEEADLFMLLFAAPEKIIFHAARIRAATLCDIPAFVEARITMIPEDERAAAAASAVTVVGEPPPPFAGDALVAHAWHDDYRPPKAWFEDPKLGQYVPIMVTDQGRVYGHAAAWAQCHLGFKDECVSPPFEDFHAYFLTGAVVCDDGSRAAVGQITAGIEHAPLYLGATAAKQHYENTDAVVADVTVGNDSHGIWVAGAIRPDAHPSRVHALRASGQVSPDWRELGGVLRMIALLTVNASGYQAPKARSFVASGQLRSLVASGFSFGRQRHQEPSEDELNRRALRLIRQQLHSRVHGEEVQP